MYWDKTGDSKKGAKDTEIIGILPFYTYLNKKISYSKDSILDFNLVMKVSYELYS